MGIRKIVSILLAGIFSLFAFQNAFTVLYFVVDQDAIIEAFCINKGKPEMMCNGKCHLQKQLAVDDEPSDKAILDFELKKSHYIKCTVDTLMLERPNAIDKGVFHYLEPFTTHLKGQLLRPPIFLLSHI